MKRVFIVCTICTLMGCSSGGGGDGGFNFSRAPAMALTSDDADLATAVVLDGIDVAMNAGGGALDLSGGAVGVKIETDNRSDPAETAVDLAIMARGFVTSTFDGGPIGAVIEQTQPCDVSGSVTVSIDTGSLSQEDFTLALQQGSIPQGTSVGMTFQQCVNTGSQQLDGGFNVTFEAFPLDGLVGVDDLFIQIKAEFDHLKADAQEVFGDLTVALTSHITGATEMESSGDLLQLTVNGETTTLIDYVISLADDGVQFFETSMDFIINDTRLPGELTITTLAPFMIDHLDDWPMSGSLKVAGADNGSLTVIALDSINVEIDLDVDGDGTPEATTFTTWDELDALSQTP